MTTGTWYYAAGEAQHGPFTLDQIRGLLRERAVDRNTYVWSPAMAEWTPLAQTELASLLGGPPPLAPLSPAVPSVGTSAGTPAGMTTGTPAGMMGGPLTTNPAGQTGQAGGFDLGAVEQGEGFPGVMLRAARIAIQNKYVDFRGRAGRPEFWWYQLFAFILLVAAQIVDAVLVKIIGLGVLNLIVALALFLPSLGASVRRLHDTNRSGWWLLLSLVPLVGGIVVLVFLCLPGDEGDNRFGPHPQRI